LSELSIKKEGFTPAYRIQVDPDLASSDPFNTDPMSTDPAKWGMMPISSDARWDAVEIAADATGYRLPTEAQWEYACRAGTTTAFNDGVTQKWNDSAAVNELGWYYSNSGSWTHEVGKKMPNAWGLYDMHGNVYEWCWDWYGTYPSNEKKKVEGKEEEEIVPYPDPLGPVSGSSRVRRGGYWYSNALGLRSACRYYYTPNSRISSFGLRLTRP